MRFSGRTIAILLIICAGCGKEESPAPVGGASADNASKKVSSISKEELDAVSKSSKPYRLALVVKTRNNPFFEPMIKAFEAEAKALGAQAEVQAPPQESDKEVQFSMVQNLTARGTDAILIAPADSKGIIPALKQAQDKGILVVNLDNRVDSSAAGAAGLNLAGYVGADNETGGRLAGEAMNDAVPKLTALAILEGIRGADNAEARKRGFRSAVDETTILSSESADWDTQKAYAKTQNMLAANPGIGGIFCANDKMALGAMKAISESGKKGKVVVIGYDNIPDVQPYLKSGELRATIEQHPDHMGKYGARMAIGILSGSIARGNEFLVPLEVKYGAGKK